MSSTTNLQGSPAGDKVDDQPSIHGDSKDKMDVVEGGHEEKREPSKTTTKAKQGAGNQPVKPSKPKFVWAKAPGSPPPALGVKADEKPDKAEKEAKHGVLPDTGEVKGNVQKKGKGSHSTDWKKPSRSKRQGAEMRRGNNDAKSRRAGDEDAKFESARVAREEEEDEKAVVSEGVAILSRHRGVVNIPSPFELRRFTCESSRREQVRCDLRRDVGFSTTVTAEDRTFLFGLVTFRSYIKHKFIYLRDVDAASTHDARADHLRVSPINHIDPMLMEIRCVRTPVIVIAGRHLNKTPEVTDMVVSFELVYQLISQTPNVLSLADEDLMSSLSYKLKNLHGVNRDRYQSLDPVDTASLMYTYHRLQATKMKYCGVLFPLAQTVRATSLCMDTELMRSRLILSDQLSLTLRSQASFTLSQSVAGLSESVWALRSNLALIPSQTPMTVARLYAPSLIGLLASRLFLRRPFWISLDLLHDIGCTAIRFLWWTQTYRPFPNGWMVLRTPRAVRASFVSLLTSRVTVLSTLAISATLVYSVSSRTRFTELTRMLGGSSHALTDSKSALVQSSRPSRNSSSEESGSSSTSLLPSVRSLLKIALAAGLIIIAPRILRHLSPILQRPFSGSASSNSTRTLWDKLRAGPTLSDLCESLFLQTYLSLKYLLAQSPQGISSQEHQA